MSRPDATGEAVPLLGSWPNRRLDPNAALTVYAVLLTSFLAASAVPSPLYGLYRQAWGFSAAMLTLVFAIYAFGLLGASLVFGSLSDHLGRRPVTIAAIALELVAMLMFRHADSVGALLAARLAQGIATGIATGVLNAATLDLDRERGALVNSVAPLVGMAVGALAASALVQFATAPTQRVFDLLLILFASSLPCAVWLPATLLPRPGAWRSLRPKVAVPTAARATLWRLLPLNTAAWALGGFYLSLGPTLARDVAGSEASLVGGAAIATLVLTGAVAVLGVRNRPVRPVLVSACVALVLGLLVTLLGVKIRSGTGFFTGTLIAGIGFGAGFNAIVRSLVPLAPPTERGAMMSAYFVCSYLAFSVPALVAGLAVGVIGLERTALGYGGVLVAMTGVVWVGLRRERR